MLNNQSRLHVNSVDLNLLDTGTGTGQPTVLFLHYWGGSARTWSDTIAELSRTNRCVALDFRGWGDSGKGPIDYSLDALAADVLAVIEELALEDYILVGHSMGGKVAQIVAATQPAGLQRLVLVAPAPPPPLPTPREVRVQIRGCLDTREGVESIIPVLANGPLNAAYRELVIENTMAGDPAAKDAWLDAGMDLDLTARASNIQVPIRVVVGDRDTVETEAALRAAFDKYYPGTDYVVIEGAGHLIPLQAPADVAAAIREAGRA